MRKTLSMLPLLALVACTTSAPAVDCAPDPTYVSCPAGSAYLCGDSVACCTDASCDDSISPADHCSLAPQLDAACGSAVALECDDGLRCFPADCERYHAADLACIDAGQGSAAYACAGHVDGCEDFAGTLDPSPLDGGSAWSVCCR